MPDIHAFDPGPCQEPFTTLCREYPGPETYPSKDFRTEWGPIFHRGRLDGSARVLVIGQDPAQHEAVTRRILVGEAGQRVQGFLSKLGVDQSYVLVNTFLYSVYGQKGGERHEADAAIAAYRDRWFDALLGVDTQVQVVVALGHLADAAWKMYTAAKPGQAERFTCVHLSHPTRPEGAAGGDPAKLVAETRDLLANWNAALPGLAAVLTPDTVRPLVPYGEGWAAGDRVEIPAFDLPPGLPAWMRGGEHWADRKGTSAVAKRRNITITIPYGVIAD